MRGEVWRDNAIVPPKHASFACRAWGSAPEKEKMQSHLCGLIEVIDLGESPAKASIPEKKGCSPLFTLLLQFSNTILSLPVSPSYIISPRLFSAFTKVGYPYDEI
jgi:hypothetical protein